jgi:hypothetical protein
MNQVDCIQSAKRDWSICGGGSCRKVRVWTCLCHPWLICSLRKTTKIRDQASYSHQRVLYHALEAATSSLSAAAKFWAFGRCSARADDGSSSVVRQRHTGRLGRDIVFAVEVRDFWEISSIISVENLSSSKLLHGGQSLPGCRFRKQIELSHDLKLPWACNKLPA